MRNYEVRNRSRSRSSKRMRAHEARKGTRARASSEYEAKNHDVIFLKERNYDTEEGFSEDQDRCMLNISYRHIKPLQKTTIITEQLSELGMPTGVLIESEVFKLKACISLIHHK